MRKVRTSKKACCLGKPGACEREDSATEKKNALLLKEALEGFLYEAWVIVQRRSKSPPPLPVRAEGKVNPNRMQVRLCGYGAFSSLWGRIKERIRQMIILKQNPAYYRLSFYACKMSGFPQGLYAVYKEIICSNPGHSAHQRRW